MEKVFSLSSLLVMPFWLAMILAPRWGVSRRVIESPLIVLAPALLYATLVLPRFGELLPALASPTLADVAGLLGSPAGATIAGCTSWPSTSSSAVGPTSTAGNAM